jgi:hypothetical protein
VAPATNTTSYTPVPINYCTGPTQFVMNLRLTKTFGFGERTGPPPDRQRGVGGGGPHGGINPGGPGGGGRGGGGGPFGGGVGSTGRRYNLAFGVQVLNVFNNYGLSTPQGSLTSQNFGRSTQLVGMPYTSNSAGRRITLQTSFNF